MAEIGELSFKIKIKDDMLQEYKEEMERHQKAIDDIMKKYNPLYDVEYDNR